MPRGPELPGDLWGRGHPGQEVWAQTLPSVALVPVPQPTPPGPQSGRTGDGHGALLPMLRPPGPKSCSCPRGSGASQPCLGSLPLGAARGSSPSGRGAPDLGGPRAARPAVRRPWVPTAGSHAAPTYPMQGLSPWGPAPPGQPSASVQPSGGSPAPAPHVDSSWPTCAPSTCVVGLVAAPALPGTRNRLSE